ncbi:Fur family transcriptional regulator [Acidiphilium acidophilum]|uniref:Ferric uptake regulation protein n=1 Tax=Acidiphilium acidophilum TaxID=76588 RepID=A0AAW9DRK1_ACIAO|nr:Fur family transcriptional regulator [Acidiphilium acidophilum]MDX5931159.1 Fur family transcriptional regulator [Acidiphilium acidophilum]GBQ15416.1 Fur family transcriptional regulator [Acidiphilium acidophilum DSM 700]
MESRIERLCVENGLKMTGPRRAIARILSEVDGHPDVDELHRLAHTLDPRISLATVYRTVRLFEQHGILERRSLGSRRARYEMSGEHDHFHLIDQESGKVIEFDEPETETLMRRVAARHGFDLISLKIELFGRKLRSESPPDRSDDARQTVEPAGEPR